MNDYEQGIKRLIERVHVLNQPWNPTPLSKQIESLSKRMDELAQELAEGGSAQFLIECEHDKEPQAETGADGLPVEPESFDIRFAGIVHHIGKLAESAKRASESLPDSRVRLALPFAATGLLYLRHEHGFDFPRLSGNSAEVQELDRICTAAGLHKARETLRNALSDALEIFDKEYLPAEYLRIVRGG